MEVKNGWTNNVTYIFLWEHSMHLHKYKHAFDLSAPFCLSPLLLYFIINLSKEWNGK